MKNIYEKKIIIKIQNQKKCGKMKKKTTSKSSVKPNWGTTFKSNPPF